MQKQGKDYTCERERALAEGIKEVASELRLIDAADFVAFIRTEQFANIGNLVSSSTELYFKPDTIKFGLSGDIDLQWGGTPSISLDMEFHHMRVNVYFRLLLEALHAGIEIDYITFDEGSADPDENTQRLVEAIANARLAPIAQWPRVETSTAAPPISLRRRLHDRDRRGVRSRPRASLGQDCAPRNCTSRNSGHRRGLHATLQRRLAAQPLAGGAPGGDRRQHRQRQHARLQGAGRPAVRDGAGAGAPGDGGDPARTYAPAVRRERPATECARRSPGRSPTPATTSASSRS